MPELRPKTDLYMRDQEMSVAVQFYVLNKNSSKVLVNAVRVLRDMGKIYTMYCNFCIFQIPTIDGASWSIGNFTAQTSFNLAELRAKFCSKLGSFRRY